VNIVKRLVARLAENFAAAALLLWCTTAAGQEAVHFPSLEDNGPGRSATPLDGYLFRPAGERKHPAVVFLHGCGGLFNRATGLINTANSTGPGSSPNATMSC
jgi:poly(3-hydroxybutyrate) depolymerase